MTPLKAIYAFSVALALTACSDAPSDDDVERAYRANVDRINGQVGKMAGSQIQQGMQIKVNSVKNQTCNESAKDVYMCNIKIDISGPLGKLQQTLPHRMAKTKDGWVLTQMY